ncbi:zinc finger, GRF-type containing protein [Tanacetum coccineum]
MVRCACGLEAVIRTSWTNRNSGRRFYGCPTLSPTCVNFLRWYDPPMCQRSVQIIPGLLRSRNELEEILAMVEEKRRKLLTFLIISWTQREAQQANELSNLTRQRQLLASVNYRRAIIQELERLPGNLVACKTREHLKCIQKAVFVEVIELKKELRLQTQREVQLATELNNLTRQLLDIMDERCSFIGELEQRLPTNVMAYKTR